MATVVCGSYERFVFGYKVDGLPGAAAAADTDSNGGVPSIVRSFTTDAHFTQCKSVAAQGGFIASGGADDLIRVWHHNPDGGLADLGTLSGHEGTVTCLAYHGPSAALEPTRLLSGGVDGTVIIWSVGQWDRLKTLKAHRGGVHAISVHQSGLVAMTAGADAHVAMWDMKKGRVAHKTKMKVKPELLAFTPSGSSYATVAGSRLTITSAESGAMTGVFDAPARVMCMTQAGSDNLALLGLEGGNIVGYDTRAAPHKPALTITKAHPTRVKGLVVPVDDAEFGAALGGPSGGPAMLVSASSEGIVRLWDLRTAGAGGGAAAALAMGVTTARDEPVAEVKGGGRFTCMAVMPSALPSTIAEAVVTERAAGTRDPEAMAARRREDKARKRERAREKAAARQVQVQPPTTQQKNQMQQQKQLQQQRKQEQQRKQQQQQQQQGGDRKKGDKGQQGQQTPQGGGQGGNRADDSFEVVAEDNTAPSPSPIPAAGDKSNGNGKGDAGGGKRRRVSPEAIGAGVGSDELLVQRKPGFKMTGVKNKNKKKGGGAGGATAGRSYEEVATAARRKGSGVKKAKPSRGFGKPARG